MKARPRVVLPESRLLFVAALAVLLVGLCAQVQAADGTQRSDVVGKVTVGYQGWFSARGDGSPVNNWGHQNLEMWPNVSEYKTTYATSAKLPNGQPARMFSSYDDQVVQTHFRWMAENGIDCAALQRFANEIRPGSAIKAQRDGMTQKVMKAAEMTGRKFYIMYDCSGWGVRGMKEDWADTMLKTLKVTSSPAYAMQNGKPVVCIYGMGYRSWPGTAAESMDLINWFKKQGCYFIGSIPGAWRTNAGDSKPDFANVYASLDMLSAWGVGRRMDANYAPWIRGDAAWCKSHGVDYQPCIFPGTSFYNTNPRTGKNLIPRRHGDFLWFQFVVLREAEVGTAYVAMFDELNEATPIFKCVEDASGLPTDKWYLALDADGVHVSSDFYLRLTNDGAKMIKKQTPLQKNCPTPPVLKDVPSKTSPPPAGAKESKDSK